MAAWDIARGRILGAAESDNYVLAAGIYAPIGDEGAELVGRAFTEQVFSNCKAAAIPSVI
jgi:hypothetical protein